MERTSNISPSLAAWLATRQRPAPGANPHDRLNFLNIRTKNDANPPLPASTDRLNIPADATSFNQMVEQLDKTFGALADPTRRAMLASLRGGERSIGELAAPHAMSFAGAAKHIAVLERAGLVERRKAGRTQLCRLRAAPMRAADAWLRQWESVWTERPAALIESDRAEQKRP